MQPFDLERVVDRQKWGWLFDLSHRLNVLTEVVDGRLSPLFSPASSPAATSLRRMITYEPPLRSMMSDAMQSGTPRTIAIDGFEVACFGLAPGGALVLAREIDNGGPAAIARDLDQIGSGLAGVLETALAAAPDAISAEPYRIASLCRILNDATTRGSVRKVVGAFVEALGVWNRVQVHAYAGAASGGFVQYVSPMTTDPSSLPPTLDDSLAAGDGEMVRLSGSDAERFGPASPRGDTFVLRILTGVRSPWVLVFKGAIDGRDQIRLRLYAEILRETLNDVIGTATNRLVAAMSRHRSLNGSTAPKIQAVLGELTLALAGQDAALVVSLTEGSPVQAIGNKELAGALEQEPRADRLIVASSEVGRLVAIIVRDLPPFTAFEREMAETAWISVHRWLYEALKYSSERRRRFRPLDELFEQLAADTLRAGEPASMLIITIESGHRGAMQSSLAKIRGELRSGDFAGILGDKEIVVLLCGASAAAAAAVPARLKQLLESDEVARESIRPTIGMTRCPPDSPFEHSAIGAARANAATSTSI